MAANNEDKHRYQNGFSCDNKISHNKKVSHNNKIIKDSYPIYAKDELIGFVELVSDIMPSELTIRDRRYKICTKRTIDYI